MRTKTSRANEGKSGSIASVVWLTSRRRLGLRMHGKQLGGADVLAFTLKRFDDRGPRRDRDAAALAPLGDHPMTFANGRRHVGRGAHAFKQVFEGFHEGTMASDNSSGQAPPIIPVTGGTQKRTIRPMGRGTTPARFRDDLAQRLKSARVVAGYQTQLEAANALAVGLDRYRKWESGRTPVPAQYVPHVCELFHIDANYLFGVQAKMIRKTA